MEPQSPEQEYSAVKEANNEETSSPISGTEKIGFLRQQITDRLEIADKLLKRGGIDPESPQGKRLRIILAGDRYRQELESGIDPITKIWDKKGFEMQFPTELSRAQRTGSPMSVIEMDVDGLKQVNDEKGHKAGDTFLHDIAQTILGELRITDIFARVGGDEFRAVLTNTDLENSRLTVNRLNEALAEKGYHVSMGTSAINLENPDESFKQADREMYENKEKYYTDNPHIKRR